MKIIMDDMRIRFEFLKQKVSDLVWFNTPSPFIARVTELEGRVDALFLDHDLGDCIAPSLVEKHTDLYGGTREVNGTDVCRALANLSHGYPRLLDTQIIIHSVNEGGARNMESILDTRGFKDVTRIEIDRLYGLINPDRLIESVCDVCHQFSGEKSKKAKIIRHKYCIGTCLCCGIEMVQGDINTICARCDK